MSSMVCERAVTAARSEPNIPGNVSSCNSPGKLSRALRKVVLESVPDCVPPYGVNRFGKVDLAISGVERVVGVRSMFCLWFTWVVSGT